MATWEGLLETPLRLLPTQVVLATGEKSPAELCAKYGYELMTVRADPMGVRVV